MYLHFQHSFEAASIRKEGSTCPDDDVKLKLPFFTLACALIPICRGHFILLLFMIASFSPYHLEQILNPFAFYEVKRFKHSLALSKVVQASHSLATSRMILGNLKEFVGQIRYKFHPACSGSTPRSSPRWTCLEYFYRKVPGKNPNQIPEPPQLAALNVKEQFHSELCPDIP